MCARFVILLTTAMHQMVAGLNCALVGGGNGDWYVVTVPEGERSISAVRLCTSGGASSAVPGLVPLFAEAFRKLAAAGDEDRYTINPSAASTGSLQDG